MNETSSYRIRIKALYEETSLYSNLTKTKCKVISPQQLRISSAYSQPHWLFIISCMIVSNTGTDTVTGNGSS